jgi:hypothetical protein
MPRQTGAYDDVGAAAFLRVRHLARYYSFNIRVAHLSARSYPMDLNRSWRRHDNDAINPPIAAGLQQQGDIQDHSAAPAAPRARDKRVFLLSHHGMQNRFQP